MAKKQYADDFFNDLARGVANSAAVTVPIITELLHPKSVVDLGCGDGGWLRAFKTSGVDDILGIEGEYVKNIPTQIGKEYYQYHNLETEYKSERKFDLAVSLEVGEHLSPASAGVFVDSLCNLSDVVLFSAAIVGQEGTMHINEQFPEYWAKLFKKRNYLPVDYVRPRVWLSEKVEPWYKQNMLLFVNQSRLPSLPAELQNCQQQTHEDYLFRIHPELYLAILKRKFPYYYAKYWYSKFKRSFKKY